MKYQIFFAIFAGLLALGSTMAEEIDDRGSKEDAAVMNSYLEKGVQALRKEYEKNGEAVRENFKDLPEKSKIFKEACVYLGGTLKIGEKEMKCLNPKSTKLEAGESLKRLDALPPLKLPELSGDTPKKASIQAK